MEFNYLNDEDLLYYSRHILLPSIGIEGQQKLNSSEVTVFGLGGLGNLLITYIASSGIKKINLVDFDIVEESNLQRQINFSKKDIGLLKVDVIENYISSRLTDIDIKKYSKKITSGLQAEDIISNSDIVIDGTDNFDVRKIINKACYIKNKTLIVGAVEGYTGQILTITSNNSPCYECTYNDLLDNRSCSETGVLAPLVGMVSSMLAIECINIITTSKSSFNSKLLIIDGLNFSINEIQTSKNPKCKICSN